MRKLAVRPYLVVCVGFAALTAAPTVLAAGPSTTECLAATESALKLRTDHKVREARRQLLICAAASCPSDVRADCTHGIDELNAQIPTIIFGAKDASGADVSGVKVTMDGEVLTQSLDGTALAVDPGDHSFTFEAASQAPVTKRFTVQQSQKDRREIVAFTTAPGPSMIAPMPPPVIEAIPAASVPLGTQKVLAIVAGGVGVVGIGVGTALGVMTLSAWSDVKSACGSGGASHCAASNPSSVNSDYSSVRTDGAVSTVGFIAGGALVATGVVLFLTAGGRNQEASAKPSIAITPAAGPGQAGLSVMGAF